MTHKCKLPRFQRPGALYVCGVCLTLWERKAVGVVDPHVFWLPRRGKKAVKFLSREVVPLIKEAVRD